MSRGDTVQRRNAEADGDFVRWISRVMTYGADIGGVVGKNKAMLAAFDENLAQRTIGDVGHDEMNKATDPPHVSMCVSCVSPQRYRSKQGGLSACVDSGIGTVTHCFRGALCSPPRKFDGITPYEVFSAFPKGRAYEPILPGRVEGASFCVSCQHSSTLTSFRPVRAVIFREVGMLCTLPLTELRMSSCAAEPVTKVIRLTARIWKRMMALSVIWRR